jgi:hypothetical protein
MPARKVLFRARLELLYQTRRIKIVQLNEIRRKSKKWYQTPTPVCLVSFDLLRQFHIVYTIFLVCLVVYIFSSVGMGTPRARRRIAD